MPALRSIVTSTVTGFFVFAFVACSSGTTTSFSDPGAAANAAEGGAPSQNRDGEPVNEVEPVQGGDGPFNLALTVNLKDASGTAKSNLMFVVVRDADTKEIVATVHDEEKSVSKVQITKKGVLEKGHRYEIGVKDTWYTYCLDSSANVWYHEVPEVEGNVALSFDVAAEVDEDPRGCDVLHAPVPLPPGTYSTSAPILGVSGNRVALVVSKTGRVYAKEFVVFCDAPTQCAPTTLTHGACEWEETVYPGETTFKLVNNSGSSTSVKGTATIDVAAKTIRYVGRTSTWKPSGTNCCDDSFDVTLTKTSTDTAGCK